jgi:hypothetical protein
MANVSLQTAAAGLRTVIESAPELDTPVFARRARNAIARAVVAAASSSDETLSPAGRQPPLEELRVCVGPALAAELAAVYDGGEGWTRHAIDLLEPLHALASRASRRPVGLRG